MDLQVQGNPGLPVREPSFSARTCDFAASTWRSPGLAAIAVASAFSNSELRPLCAEHAGASEKVIGVVGGRLAVDQSVRLAAKHLTKHQGFGVGDLGMGKAPLRTPR